ncbi:MAG: ADP-ribosyltransferase domain-containing protein [Myxococcaceae bacterium]|jgi:hypothetical protein|nr:ADP-ribosyltransferase domain-containing protein [Myxococcaceae bacterium]
MTTVRNAPRPVGPGAPGTSPAAPAKKPEATAPVAAPKAGWTSQGPATSRPTASGKPPPEASQLVADAQAIHDAFHGGVGGVGTNEEKLFGVLASRSPQHLAEVKRVYQEHFHRSLDTDLSRELSGRDLSRATALMAGDGVQAQVEALKSATSGFFGTNTKELLALLEATPPGAMKSVADRFKTQFGPLDQALGRSLSGAARDEALALLNGNRPAATAANLDRSLNLNRNAAEVLARLSQLPPDARGAVATAYQARTGKPLAQDLAAKLKGTEKDMAVAMAQGDTLGLKAAKLKHAVEGKFFGLGKDATAALAVVEGLSAQDRAALKSTYQQRYGASLDADVVSRFGGREGARLEKAFAGTLDDVERVQIALQGWGADEKAIESVLGGRSKEQVQKLAADFQQRTGTSLAGAIEKELSGRARFEAQLALQGTPSTPEEQLAQAQQRRDFERSGVVNGVSRFLMDRVSDSGGRLDESTALAQQALAAGKKDGHLDAREQARVAELVARSTGEAKTYVSQKASAAQAAGTVAAVAATVATAGAGAPLLVTAAAGAGASVVARGAMEGRAYSRDEAIADAASGVVSGLAGAAGGAVVGKAATSVGGRVAQEAAKGAVTGFIQGSADSALRDETWNAGLVEGLAASGLAGSKSALQSAALAGGKVLAEQAKPWTMNVVATKFPGEKEPVDLSKYKSDAATRKATREMLKKQGTLEQHESMAKFLQKNEPALKKVALDDLIGLREYTADGYKAMNEGLRGSRTALKATAPVVKTAASALNQLPEVKGTVYRGANLDAERLAKYKVGEVVTERGFTSTTVNKAMVMGQTAEQQFNKNSMFVIKSAGGGRDVSILSQFPEEKEVLFGPGTEFKVLKNAFDKKLGKNVIYLQEVP